MSPSPGHIALLSANQFDPLLRDGGSLDVLTRLRFLQRRGAAGLYLQLCARRRFPQVPSR
ncbi:MAG: hypothetical protein FJ026_18130 [Chloroflexi bacterium]|nr:hypothetical protein [Chloroflexota bacterium]